MTIVVSNQIAAAIGIALFAFAANAEPVASGTQSPVTQVRDILLTFNLPDIVRAAKAPRPQYTPVQDAGRPFTCTDSVRTCCCMSQNSNTTKCMTEAECKGDAGPWAGGTCVGPIFPPGGVTDGCQ